MAIGSERFAELDSSEYNVSLDGSFTGGTLRVVRVGTLVTISLVSPNYAGSATSIASSTGLLPAEFRPSAALRLWGSQETNIIRTIRISTDGQVSIANIIGGLGGGAVPAPSSFTLVASYHIY